jgi:hypothetical protein
MRVSRSAHECFARLAGTVDLVAAYGQPRSFLDVDKGVNVVSSDGQRVGVLEHVLADEQSDIFYGIVIDTATGPGGHRFVDSPEVSEFRERAVLLSISARDVGHLPKPSANPAVMHHGGEEDAEGSLARKLRRAWDLVSGRY